MAWETRGTGGRTYYYRKRKAADGRVVSEYAGSGLLAMLEASRMAEDRRERAATAATERAERNRMHTDEAALDGFCAFIDALARAALLDAGYHQHHRGEWRKRRG
jgi:glucokinase